MKVFRNLILGLLLLVVQREDALISSARADTKKDLQVYLCKKNQSHSRKNPELFFYKADPNLPFQKDDLEFWLLEVAGLLRQKKITFSDLELVRQYLSEFEIEYQDNGPALELFDQHFSALMNPITNHIKSGYMFQKDENDQLLVTSAYGIKGILEMIRVHYRREVRFKEQLEQFSDHLKKVKTEFNYFSDSQLPITPEVIANDLRNSVKNHEETLRGLNYDAARKGFLVSANQYKDAVNHYRTLPGVNSWKWDSLQLNGRCKELIRARLLTAADCRKIIEDIQALTQADSALEALVGNHVLGITNDIISWNKKVSNQIDDLEAQFEAETDLQTSRVFIEVTLGSGLPGKLKQVRTKYFSHEVNPFRKPVILYAPNFSETMVKNYPKDIADVSKAPFGVLPTLLCQTQSQLHRALKAVYGSLCPKCPPK
jgi:hypothetical protein